jgi:predicted secreted Zn-dependent protease
MTHPIEWRKSSYSINGDCVEVQQHPGWVLVRDSKHPDGPVLTFTPHEWAAFLAGVRDREFDRP